MTLENYGKTMGPLPFLSPANAPERKKKRGPRRIGSGGGPRSTNYGLTLAAAA
jgi:hypothetical protein